MQLRMVTALTFATALGCMALACGGDDDEGTTGTGGSAGGTGGAGGAAQTIQVGATFADYLTQQPIEGLEICTLIPSGRDPGCATTGPTGKIVADGFPINSDVLFKLTKDEYFTTLVPATTADKNDTGSTLFPVKRSDVELLVQSAGLTLEAGKGAISFRADKSAGGETGTADGLDGVTVSITPQSGTLVYMKSLTLDPTATETDLTGMGAILNVEPDKDYTLTFTYSGTPARTCKARMGWVTAEETASKAPVKADMITYVLHQCVE